ncbi:hypothetical protein GYN07_34680 [Rhizobium leguminosarum bv. viciae 248]|uniref:hypothetical protein n=1 Tax=Rhizobium leguminosarum TaxID=384 RepID=UPI0003A55124|nr:hypothetical protein [Rhizobium leguminosarum]QPZ93596.1 hypothetical protein GYN07_34680 [Rhizobium leguminosarum bv. viciae 248]
MAASDFFADMIKKSGGKRRILGVARAFTDNRRIIGRTDVLIFGFVPSLAQSGRSMASASERLLWKPKALSVAPPTSPSGWHRSAEAIINEPSTPTRRQVRP